MSNDDTNATPPASHDATALDTNAIRARLAEITPGQWRNLIIDDSDSGGRKIYYFVQAEDKLDVCDSRLAQDNEFIAHAPADITALLAHIDTLAASLTAARERVAELEREAVNLRKTYGVYVLAHHYDDEYVEALHAGLSTSVATQPSAPRSETPAPAPTVATTPIPWKLTERQIYVLSILATAAAYSFDTRFERRGIHKTFEALEMRGLMTKSSVGLLRITEDGLAAYHAATASDHDATDARTDGGS